MLILIIHFAYIPVGGSLSGTFTLNANATSTTVSIPGISSSSTVIWAANTANAANAVPFLRGVPGTNQIVLTHASNAHVDQTFSYIAYTSGLKGTFTLNANATSTTVSISGSTSLSQIFWAPTTANGASALPEMYATPGTNQVIFTHASNAHVDQTFSYILQNPINPLTFTLNAMNTSSVFVVPVAPPYGIFWSPLTAHAANILPYLYGTVGAAPF